MPMGYSVTAVGFSGAAPKAHIEVIAGALMRVKYRGVMMGSTSATAAAGVGWSITKLTTTGTGTAQTPEKLDTDDIASRMVTSKVNMSVIGTGTNTNPTYAVGFDAVGTYILWFPPNAEPVTSGATGMHINKTLGSETGTWNVTLIWEE